MFPGRLWILYGKKKSGELSEEESAELDAALSGPDGGDFTHELMDHLWESPLQPVPEMNMNKDGWQRIENRIAHPQNRVLGMEVRILSRVLAAAALVAVIVLAALLYPSHRAGSGKGAVDQLAMNHVSTQNGSRTRLELPDGTKVWLNGNSQLTYGNKSFGTEEREVFLNGEAFFDVARNEKAPFTIHTGDVTITVLGTAFNVRAYGREKTVETSLIRGMVAITTRKDPDRRIILKPNEKIILPVDSSGGEEPGKAQPGNLPPSPYTIVKLRKDSTQIIPETVWMNNKLEFDNELLEELAPKLENWFNVKIHFRDPMIGKRRFSGVIEKETLPQLLEAMKLSGNFSYEIREGELWIGKK
jgi:transmembrane sensor